jgi:predicted DNA-binding transcriptional regulator AlpA
MLRRFATRPSKSYGVLMIMVMVVLFTAQAVAVPALTDLAPDDLLTPYEVAGILRCTRNALYVMRYRGEGPPVYRLGRRLLYSRREVLAWVAEQREKAVAPGLVLK